MPTALPLGVIEPLREFPKGVRTMANQPADTDTDITATFGPRSLEEIEPAGHEPDISSTFETLPHPRKGPRRCPSAWESGY